MHPRFRILDAKPPGSVEKKDEVKEAVYCKLQGGFLHGHSSRARGAEGTEARRRSGKGVSFEPIHTHTDVPAGVAVPDLNPQVFLAVSAMSCTKCHLLLEEGMKLGRGEPFQTSTF